MNQHDESKVALLVGGDLDDAERREVERRVAICPETRTCHREMQAGMAALHECRDHEPTDDTDEESLWPAMATRLPERRAAGPLEAARPWVPAITVAALLLALLTVATNPHRSAVAPEPVARSTDWPLEPVRPLPSVVAPATSRDRPIPVDSLAPARPDALLDPRLPAAPATGAPIGPVHGDGIRVLVLPNGRVLFDPEPTLD